MGARLRCFLAVAVLVAGMAPAWAEDKPGKFDYYSLVLSWSPTYCARQGDRRGNDPQCSGDRPFAFIMHGFWPQYEEGWPSYCETGERPWVPETVISNMLDIMPSKRLVIHQYRKHGVCSGLDPKAYFEKSRKAFEAITIPEKYRALPDYLTTSPDEVEQAFLKVNPALTPEMINVDCKNRRLREMRICFTRDLNLRNCGPNDRQEKLCSASEIVMPPVRVGAARNRGDYENGQGYQNGGGYQNGEGYEEEEYEEEAYEDY